MPWFEKQKLKDTQEKVLDFEPIKPLEVKKYQAKHFSQSGWKISPEAAQLQELKPRLINLPSQENPSLYSPDERPGHDRKFAPHPFLNELLALEKGEQKKLEQKIETMAHQERKKAHSEGFQEGFRQGHEQGFQVGMQECQQKAQTDLGRLKSTVDSMEKLKDALLSAHEQVFLKVLKGLVEKIILKEVQNPEYLLKLFKKIIKDVDFKNSFLLKIHPQDQAFIADLDQALPEAWKKLYQCTIQVSEEVEGGGCQIDTDLFKIDASIRAQLETLETFLFETPGT